MKSSVNPESRLVLESGEDYDLILFGALDTARRIIRDKELLKHLGRISDTLLEKLLFTRDMNIDPVYELIGGDADKVLDAVKVFAQHNLKNMPELVLERQLTAEALDLLEVTGIQIEII